MLKTLHLDENKDISMVSLNSSLLDFHHEIATIASRTTTIQTSCTTTANILLMILSILLNFIDSIDILDWYALHFMKTKTSKVGYLPWFFPGELLLHQWFQLPYGKTNTRWGLGWDTIIENHFDIRVVPIPMPNIGLN